jgi:hypothetical protein
LIKFPKGAYIAGQEGLNEILEQPVDISVDLEIEAGVGALALVEQQPRHRPLEDSFVFGRRQFHLELNEVADSAELEGDVGQDQLVYARDQLAFEVLRQAVGQLHGSLLLHLSDIKSYGIN